MYMSLSFYPVLYSQHTECVVFLAVLFNVYQQRVPQTLFFYLLVLCFAYFVFLPPTDLTATDYRKIPHYSTSK